jgi:hypothetical protein
VGTKSNIISIVEASHPEFYGATSSELSWKDCWAECPTLPDCRTWAKRAEFEGWAWVIAKTASRANEPQVGQVKNGPRRMFSLFVTPLDKDVSE